MGLYDSAYWLSWLTWETVVTLISSILIVLSGMMFQFSFFLKNSFAVLFFLFFLFELNMVRIFLLYHIYLMLLYGGPLCILEFEGFSNA
jgi:hypothetical protein